MNDPMPNDLQPEAQQRDTQQADAPPSKLPIRVLRQLQDAAWARGDSRISAAQLRKIRRSPAAPTVEETPTKQITPALEARPGDAITPDTPGYYDLVPGPATARMGTGARKSRRDPQKIYSLIEHLIGKKGWEEQMSAATVIELWPTVAGEQIAANSIAESFDNGTLVVRAKSTAWAQTLRYCLPTIMRSCDEVMPVDVQKVIIKGPKAPSWKHGPLSVRGRGPRDTYG